MNKKVVLIVVVAGVAGACCFAGGALVVLGSNSVNADTASAPSAAGAKFVGTWLLSSPTMETWHSLRGGAALSTTSFTNGGGVIELHADGTCLRDTLFASNSLGCTIGAYTHYDECTWTLDDDVLSLALDDGTIRSTTCEVKTESTKDARAHTERGRVALKTEGGTEYLTFVDQDTGTAVDFRRSPQ